ncbi:MAG: hypothetical protein R3174_10405 [Gammaproteobacteria bacterium]|nr:hypothetical protein [Gammaproteobacteria bacterium]
MSALVIREILGWCTLINFGLLLWWASFFFFAHDWLYRLHTRWFRIEVERFDAIHYAGMAFFKLSVVVLNLVPYLALHIVL